MVCRNGRCTCKASSGKTRKLRQAKKPAKPNGCGPKTKGIQKLLKVVQKLVKRHNPICNEHDICYETCGTTQAKCDGDFKRDMYKMCNGLRNGFKRGVCKAKAKAMYLMVRVAGKSYFHSGQKKYCSCN